MLDPEALDMLHEALDTKYCDADGAVKTLRFFTARDCRAFHNPLVVGLADLIDETDLVTLGEWVAREEALMGSGCPRCAFENALRDVVYSGEFIEQRYGRKRGHLSETERHLLGLAREWLADDAIERCLEEG